MDQLDSVFQSILKCHNFSEHLELEVWIREALTMKTISFVIYKNDYRYYMNLIIEKEKQGAILDVTNYLVELLTCTQLNPTRHMSYYSNEGILYAYCEAISNYEKANVMSPLMEVKVTIDKAKKYTSVDFISERDWYPCLHVKFRFS